jgi:hypothetical protein
LLLLLLLNQPLLLQQLCFQLLLQELLSSRIMSSANSRIALCSGVLVGLRRQQLNDLCALSQGHEQLRVGLQQDLVEQLRVGEQSG